MAHSISSTQFAATGSTGDGGSGRHRGRPCDNDPFVDPSGPFAGRHRRSTDAPRPRWRRECSESRKGAGTWDVSTEGGDVQYQTDSAPPSERFEHEVQTFLNRAYGAALTMTGSAADAERLVLETFARAFSSLPSLRLGADIEAWISSTLASVYIDDGRRQHGDPTRIDNPSEYVCA
ncbi:sigma factor [Actinacidiphila glaucinigra]|uniref:sigma factor n=1 Tax=Actinacidiphila glaucinigra TaxID=235986 RepID=UPI0037C87A1C